jgi:hypothetical protein
MATKTTVRVIYPKIDASVPAVIQRHLVLIYERLNNHALAFEHQTNMAKSQTPASGAVRAVSGGGSVGGGGGSGSATAGVTSFNSKVGSVTYFPGLGFVNNQSGSSSYAVVTNDRGQLILLNSASAVAVSLSAAVGTPWFTTFFNQGAGTATLTPLTGTINGGASFPVPGGAFGLAYFDGTNWFAADSGNGGVNSGNAYKAVSANYTALPGDYQIECTVNSLTVTLPTAVGITGKIYSVKNSGTGTITLATTSSQTIDGALTQTLTQWDNLVVFSNGANWIIV